MEICESKNGNLEMGKTKILPYEVHQRDLKAPLHLKK